MGCLRKIIKSVILCLAFIGFLSIGGSNFLQEKHLEFVSKYENIVKKKAMKIADFSDINSEFEITQTANLFGYNGVIAEHKASGQKMIILDSKDKELITPDDIKNNRVKDKINQLTDKFKYSAIKIEDLKVGKHGVMVLYNEPSNYVTFTAKISKLPIGNVEGIISSYEDSSDNQIIIAMNKKDKYSQLITNEFFRKVKK